MLRGLKIRRFGLEGKASLVCDMKRALWKGISGEWHRVSKIHGFLDQVSSRFTRRLIYNRAPCKLNLLLYAIFSICFFVSRDPAGINGCMRVQVCPEGRGI